VTPPRGEVPHTTTRWIKMVVGFGVSVAAGLSPFLGNFKVPLFSPLLNLFPPSLRATTIPVSAALMGLTAIVVQWNARGHAAKVWIERTFRRTLFLSFAALFLLYLSYSQLITPVPIQGGTQTLYFVTGFRTPTDPPCSGMSSSECIAQILTTNEKHIDSYFGER
jgi:hypothetical protein